jgi:GNAT superfamily N-acetyltransferase
MSSRSSLSKACGSYGRGTPDPGQHPGRSRCARSDLRRAALTNDADRAWILANPQQAVLDEGPILAGRSRVAVVEGRAVGFATLVGNELEDLFVDPDWMRRGIAKALVRDAAANVDRIDVTANMHAQAFYEAAGFVHDETVDTPGGPAHRMHLDCEISPRRTS